MGAPPNLVYVGSYTRTGQAEGISVFDVDPETGLLSLKSSIQASDPSFLAFDPSRRFLFATSEALTADEAAAISFSIDQDSGALTWLSSQPTAGGEPCHLTVDPTGDFLIVANHENGSVAVFPIDTEGRLGPASDFKQHHGSGPGPTQQGPHTHHVTFDPPQRRVLITDKGIDQVVVYQLADGKLVPNDPPFGQVHAGAAPRHLAFGASGQFAYVNGEADMTLMACSYDPSTGTLAEQQSVDTLPDGADRDGVSTAEVVVASNGRFVYVSNRGHDSITVFAIDATDGHLTMLANVATGGRTPRNFAIDPSGRRLYAANQDSDAVVHFDVDQLTGLLTPNGDVTQVGSPVCILFS